MCGVRSLPAAHGAHSDFDPMDEVPGGHAVQFTVPNSLENVPATQFVQDCEPDVVWPIPGGQRVQITEREMGENLPGAQTNRFQKEEEE